MTDSCLNDGAVAHDARFQRYVEGCPLQSVIAKLVTCLSNTLDFCMCCRVFKGDGLVEALGDNLAIEHNNSTNGNFSLILGD